jgi:thiol peroxidase
MSLTALKGAPINTNGSIPEAGQDFPNLRLVKADMSVIETKDLAGKKIVFNYMPSVDTAVCALQLKQFSNRLKGREDVVLVFASYDLPFALNRFCAAEGVENAITTSDFRFKDLDKIGVVLTEGPLTGLAARGTIVIDENQKVLHSELTKDIVDEPNYDSALKFV